MLISCVAPPAVGAESQAGKSKTDSGQRVELRPRLVRSNDVYGVEYWSGPQLVGSASPATPAGIELRLPGELFKPVEFRESKGRGNKLELGPANIGSLTLRLRVERVNPSLLKRTLTVTAAKPQQFAASFDFFPAAEGGSFATFTGAESSRKIYDTLGGGPEYPGTPGQTFPMAAFHHEGRVFGVVADSPALWENRCLMLVDPAGRKLAARELGFPVKEEEIERAIAGYRRMYNATGKFMPTSLKQDDVIGQDTLYGAALTYAVFGRQLLADDQVMGHMRTTLKIQSPYGMRVISKADGALLPGHSGEYVFGGSWFLCDAANYLVAGLHGMPAAEVDERLIWRIEKELAFVPAFNESISTVTGKPHGHILYSWNSGYWWLRKEFRKRQKQRGPDPVEVVIDQKLGVIRDKSGLRLEPAKATLRPKKN